MISRRKLLLGLAAAPLIAEPSLELIERLTWRRTLWPAGWWTPEPKLYYRCFYHVVGGPWHAYEGPLELAPGLFADAGPSTSSLDALNRMYI